MGPDEVRVMATERREGMVEKRDDDVFCLKCQRWHCKAATYKVRAPRPTRDELATARRAALADRLTGRVPPVDTGVLRARLEERGIDSPADKLIEAFGRLSVASRGVLSLRYSVEGKTGTFRSVAEVMGLSAARVQQLERQAWRDLWRELRAYYRREDA